MGKGIQNEKINNVQKLDNMAMIIKMKKMETIKF